MSTILLGTCLVPQVSRAVTLSWNPSPGPGIAGYRIYYGLISGVYTGRTDVGLTNTATVSGLSAGLSYYFAVTAYDVHGLESPYSLEISYAVPNLLSTVTDFVNSQVTGILRNSFNGFLGMQIQVGPVPITITALGRMVLSGNSGTHILKLVNATNGTDVPGGSVSVSMAGGTVGQFQYGNLGNPIGLAPGASYYIVSQEISGGDYWYFDNTTVNTTPAATDLSAVWGTGDGQWFLDGTIGQSYGPLDFKYATNVPPSSAKLITTTSLGTLRNSYNGFLGMQIAVGPNPMKVTGLGRIVAPGNTSTHLVKLVNASDGTDVPGGSVSIAMAQGTVGQFQYANLASPIVLGPGTSYYVMSQETSGGDFWYYCDTTVKTTPVATDTTAAWGLGDGHWYLAGSVGQSYGPVDLLYTTNSPPSPTNYIVAETPGTLRNSFNGFIGMQIRVGASPITVTSLGRLVISGNNSTHIVKLVNGADGTDVTGGSVSVSTVSGTPGQFQYTNLGQPIRLTAGAVYYVVSQETSGGDAWYFDDTKVQTTSAASEISAEWGLGDGTWYSDGSAGQSYGAVDFKYTISSP